MDSANDSVIGFGKGVSFSRNPSDLWRPSLPPEAMGRYFNPRTIRWDGPNAEYTPESDDIPWSLVPEHKITVEEVKYILSSHFQGTPYDPYGKVADPERGKYRPIGISRTAFMNRVAASIISFIFCGIAPIICPLSVWLRRTRERLSGESITAKRSSERQRAMSLS